MAFINAGTSPARDMLRNVKYEPMKIYRVFDANNRLATQYECFTSTLNGGDCLRTDYAYDGTSNRITKLKESMTVWSSAWEL